MSEKYVASENTGLKKRTTWFALSAIFELCGRLNLDIFQKPRVICPVVDAHIKLVPNSNKYFVKSASPAQGALQEKFKVDIEKVALNIGTKDLISDAALAYTAILEQK